MMSEKESKLRSQLARNQVNLLVKFTGGDGMVIESLDGEWLTFYANNRLLGVTEMTDDLLDDIDRLYGWLCWLFCNNGQVLQGEYSMAPMPKA